MQRVAQGEIHAFRIVAEALDSRLERFFAQLGVPASDRADLFQETCLKLFCGAARYDSRRPFLPWALTVARRVMLNWHRARKPTVELDKARCVADTLRPVPETSGADDVWTFARARLPAAACELLWLRYGEDLEPAEIAVVTPCAPAHASRVARVCAAMDTLPSLSTTSLLDGLSALHVPQRMTAHLATESENLLNDLVTLTTVVNECSLDILF